MNTVQRFGVLAAAFALMGTQVQAADAYMKEQSKDDGRITARGWVDKSEDGGNYVFTVHVETKVKGRGKEGRGHAIFMIFGEGDKVISVLDTSKYCSTGIDNEKEKGSEQQRKYKKAYYDANVVSEMLVVVPEDKGGVPGTQDELVKWTKEVAGAELIKLRDGLKAGETKEAAGAFIRRLK